MEGKINGRLTLTEIQLASVAEESSSAGGGGGGGSSESCNAGHQRKKKSLEVRPSQERRTDEKIIAEILKPEERIRLSKSSDRSLKVSGTNTAISLDS